MIFTYNTQRKQEARFYAHAPQSATARLRKFSWAADLDQVVWKYSRETDQTRKDILGKAYREITGHEIRGRQTFLLD
jgi:hypothetical protein